MVSAQPPQPLERRPENRRRSPDVPPFVVPAGPLRPERSESFYEDLEVGPAPAVVAGPALPALPTTLVSTSPTTPPSTLPQVPPQAE